MPQLAGLAYLPLIFDRNGALPACRPARLCPAGVTDLIVISHGWHQDPDDAGEMYREIVQHFLDQGGAALPGRRFAVVGVFWPSDMFRDDLSLEVVAALGDTPAAAAAAGGADADPGKLEARARAVADLLAIDADGLVLDALAAARYNSPGDARALVARLRTATGGTADEDLQGEHGLILDPALDGWDLMQHFQGSGANQGEAGDQGGAQAIDPADATAAALGIFSGGVAAVAKILNQFAYFALKKRAGVVGAALGRLVDTASLQDAQRIHYVGHSFGARLVTAATAAMTARKPYSLSLLQAAFSHNAFGVRVRGSANGAFRTVVADHKVSRRIVVSHTWNDHAVGLLYAIASRASGDVAAAIVAVTPTFGGALDIYGGMGANGPQKMLDGEVFRAPYDGGAAPALTHPINSLLCDFIKNHSDIRTVQVGRLLVAAMG